MSYREGAASLNDMKDMLANLPQYQEQRDKVRKPKTDWRGGFSHAAAVLSAPEHGARLYEHFRARQASGCCQC